MRQDISFRNKRCEMSKSRSKKVFSCCKYNNLGQTIRSCFQNFIFDKIKFFTVFNFYYPSPETGKNNGRKMILTLQIKQINILKKEKNSTTQAVLLALLSYLPLSFPIFLDFSRFSSVILKCTWH